MTAEPGRVHIPVLLPQVLELLSPRPGECFVDATFGAGGHATAILGHVLPGGRVFGVDRDQDILRLGKSTYPEFIADGSLRLVHGNFADLPGLFQDEGLVGGVDGLLIDLGVSSYQLDTPERGFSFQSEGPLDMRMDQSTGKTAADLVATLPETALADLIYKYGEERFSRRIAAAIVSARRNARIETTAKLADIVAGAVRRRGRIHPATRTFQALRIAVNGELDALESALEALPRLLKPGGRAGIITFHSLEDRMVKQALRGHVVSRILSLVNKKPIQADVEAIRANPRSRSAKLRAAVRTTP